MLTVWKGTSSGPSARSGATRGTHLLQRVSLLLCGVAVASALVGDVPAHAAKRSKGAARTVTVEYEPVQGEVGVGPLGAILHAVSIPAGPEAFVSIEIVDASGAAVLGEIIQDKKGPSFCGSTEQPVQIRPHFDLTIYLYEGRCLDGSPSVASNGHIEATFYNTPPTRGRRVDVREYALVAPHVVGFGDNGLILGGVSFDSGPRERYLTLAIDDDNATAVAAYVEAGANDIGGVCSRTDKPIRIPPNMNIEITLYAGQCDDGTPSFFTHGTVTATFSSRP